MQAHQPAEEQNSRQTMSIFLAAVHNSVMNEAEKSEPARTTATDAIHPRLRARPFHFGLDD